MTPDRRSRLVLLVLVLAAIGALCWRLATASKVERPDSMTPSISARVVTPAASAVPAVSSLTPRARLLVAEKQVGAPDSACAMPSATEASGVDADDPAVRAAFLSRPGVVALMKGIRHVDASLRASADPFARAVALWLNVPPTADDAAGIPAGERLLRLATMASSTADPRIYALAFRTCSGSNEAACQALSARRWAVLDPDNAVPWLFLLNDAERAGDASGQQEAWFHIAGSARFDERFYTQLQPVLAVATPDPDDQRAAEVLSVMGIGTAAAQPIDFGPLLRGCRANALADANRAQLCARVADLMFEHSDAPTTRQFGASMTKRLTGDNRRNEQVAEERRFWIANDPGAPQGCAELHRQLDLVRSLATNGSHGTYTAMTSGSASPGR